MALFLGTPNKSNCKAIERGVVGTPCSHSADLIFDSRTEASYPDYKLW